ncbi:hypothetical protein PsorP6_010000 [Peronosclerospora sorghi]|uniref:Uncharacterized protein n=1 Tax=Peronosclerospora sorghi TaxID=230839 RepID=A0ACC0VVG7_9STRA|nr:hypothetical protein PsorP6_010000 [Peronosclerospora sorghi]
MGKLMRWLNIVVLHVHVGHVTQYSWIQNQVLKSLSLFLERHHISNDNLSSWLRRDLSTSTMSFTATSDADFFTTFWQARAEVDLVYDVKATTTNRVHNSVLDNFLVRTVESYEMMKNKGYKPPFGTWRDSSRPKLFPDETRGIIWVSENRARSRTAAPKALSFDASIGFTLVAHSIEQPRHHLNR